MPEDLETEEPGHDGSVPSKSALKRRMLALQQLGQTLTGLSDKQLERIPIADERLRSAIVEARRITSRSARRRHLQLIGKLMRDVDPGPIEAALEALDRGRRAEAAAFHELEALREQMLAAGPEGVELALARWPRADRQQLRQLILQHQREAARGQPPAASRSLFRYLRDLQETYGESG